MPPARGEVNLDISWRGVKQAGRSGEIWNLRPHKPESADLNYKSSNWAVQVRRMLERRDELQDRNDRGCRSNDPEISATVGVLEVHLPARALQSLILVPGANEFTLSTGFDTLRSPQTRREKMGFTSPRRFSVIQVSCSCSLRVDAVRQPPTRRHTSARIWAPNRHASSSPARCGPPR